jgi:hypothetical protein
MQPDELTQAARQVLPASVPDSGTAGRQILSQIMHPAGLGAGAAGVTALAGFAPLAAAGLGASALYTKAGMKAATQGIHPIVKALRRGAPYDPNATEDVIRNLIGRTTTAAGTD